MKPSYAVVQEKIQAIEAELKRIGFWQNEPLKPKQYNFERAFAMDTMAYSQWLQFIFLPRVKEIIATQGTFPSQSVVGTQAVREFDGVDEASELLRLLAEFDALFQ